MYLPSQSSPRRLNANTNNNNNNNNNNNDLIVGTLRFRTTTGSTRRGLLPPNSWGEFKNWVDIGSSQTQTSRPKT